MAKVLVPRVCPYCGAGCGFFISVEREARYHYTGIEYMPDRPVSEGALYSKGNAALEIPSHHEPLTSPLKRKGDGRARISWKDVIDLATGGLCDPIKKQGPESIAFLSSSTCSNAENYVERIPIPDIRSLKCPLIWQSARSAFYATPQSRCYGGSNRPFLADSHEVYEGLELVRICPTCKRSI